MKMTHDAEVAQGLADVGLPLIALHRPVERRWVPRGVLDLLAALAESDDPLFRLCLIPAFLALPEAKRFASAIRIDERARLQYEHLYTAAVALERLWDTRLALAGLHPKLLDHFSLDLRLPSPEEDYGRSCLIEVFERLDQGQAGSRIRGASSLVANLIEQMFEIVRREEQCAKTR